MENKNQISEQDRSSFIVFLLRQIEDFAQGSPAIEMDIVDSIAANVIAGNAPHMKTTQGSFMNDVLFCAKHHNDNVVECLKQAQANGNLESFEATYHENRETEAREKAVVADLEKSLDNETA